MKTNKPLKILKIREVENKVNLSRSQIYLLASKKKFPGPLTLGGKRSSGWLEHEIDTWILHQAANRDNRPTKQRLFGR